MDELLEATARAEERHFWFKAFRRNARRLVAGALSGRDTATIVDCGTGTGRNLDWLDQFGLALGVEMNPAGLAAARASGRPRRLVRGSVGALPLAGSSVDAATSFDVLYCLNDDLERDAVAEMWRVLRPGGAAIVSVAALDILRGSHSTLTGEVRRYTPGRLRALLEAAGFVIERLTFTNMATFPVTLAVRTFDRVTGRDAVASDADLGLLPAPVNWLFDVLLRAEGVLLGWMELPVGSSLLCVARKPTGPPTPASHA